MEEKIKDLERIFTKYYHSTKELTIETILKESHFIKSRKDFQEVWEEYQYRKEQESFKTQV